MVAGSTPDGRLRQLGRVWRGAGRFSRGDARARYISSPNSQAKPVVIEPTGIEPTRLRSKANAGEDWIRCQTSSACRGELIGGAAGCLGAIPAISGKTQRRMTRVTASRLGSTASRDELSGKGRASSEARLVFLPSILPHFRLKSLATLGR